MPRYYFHLLNDLDAPDEDGVELPDLEAALQYARNNAIFTAAETIKEHGHLVRSHRIDIEDAHGTVLATVRFEDVITIEGITRAEFKADSAKKDARPKPGALQRDEVSSLRRVVRLDCLEVQRAGGIVVGARLIRETLADRRKTVLIPSNRALFEANEIAANFRLDFAASLDRVERMNGSKKLHDEFLSGHAPKLASCLLGDVKDGGRCDLAPKTVDFDW